MNNPNPWIEYQPCRARDKVFYDIELRDGTVILNCYPNGVHWNPWVLIDEPVKTKFRGSIADYRVVRIRKSHPDSFDL